MRHVIECLNNLCECKCSDMSIKTMDEMDKKYSENKLSQKLNPEGHIHIPSENINKDINKPVTQLLQKNFSPMIIRKYMSFGWPLFVAVICDLDLSSLDDAVIYFVKKNDPKLLNGIQDFRNFCGKLSQYVIDEYDGIKYGSVEGVAVIGYWDKIICSSLYGDFMTHTSCRIELFSLLNMLPHV